MPTYDYECDACHHKWELFQSIKADPIKACPACKKKKARRVIGPGAGIIFKGSGFYQTDYRSSSYQQAAEADQKAQSSASSDATKSESKSETKSESATPAKTETKSSPKKKS